MLGLPCAALAQPGELGVNLYGFSYHFERERARELGLDNGINPGLGLRYRRPYSERIDLILDAGVYYDSGRNTAWVAGGGALWKVSQSLRLGVALAAFRSDSYNRGEVFLSPLPLAAWEFRSVMLNAMIAPKLAELNQISTFAFWLTYWIGR
ncbi:MAG: hypothetical protein M3544_10230 [Pseudomonadota bacterium]|nr:hypothetical protein [Pseudomonadota bacterium]